MKSQCLAFLEGMLAADVSDNKVMGAHGAAAILRTTPAPRLNIITHCNTGQPPLPLWPALITAGSLATGGFGTALGVIRTLFQQGRIEKVPCRLGQLICSHGSRYIAPRRGRSTRAHG